MAQERLVDQLPGCPVAKFPGQVESVLSKGGANHSLSGETPERQEPRQAGVKKTPRLA